VILVKNVEKNKSNKIMDKKIVGLAGTLLLGVAGWLISTVYTISIDTQLIKEKMDKVYADTLLTHQ